MTIQIQTRLTIFPNYQFSLLTHPICIEPTQATSRDFGFDFDEEELANDLASPNCASSLDGSGTAVEADEFEALYQWFSS